MHVMIINGSPRVKQYSNTDKILAEFTQGMTENGTTFEQYEVSDRSQWDAIRAAYEKNDNILIALPLYVECIPGLLLEFLETLTPKSGDARMSFILQSGFAEGVHMMHVHDDFALYIPYYLGYGAEATGTEGNYGYIPPYSTLVYEVHLKAMQ